MKIKKINHKQTGFTLVEITLVITLILSLVAILALGTSAYVKAGQRTRCILIINAAQKAIRAYGGFSEIKPGGLVNTGDDIISNNATIFGKGRYIEKPLICPSQGTYTFVGEGDSVPPLGVYWVNCSLNGSQDHVPTDTPGI